VDYSELKESDVKVVKTVYGARHDQYNCSGISAAKEYRQSEFERLD
jgi:hypothetical protein